MPPWGARGDGPGGLAPVSPGGDLVTLASTKPAAVVFSLGQTRIEVDPQDFYEAYILYSDLKARGIIVADGFGAVIKDSLMLAWRMLVGGLARALAQGRRLGRPPGSRDTHRRRKRTARATIGEPLSGGLH